jgi:hypothetical protein
MGVRVEVDREAVRVRLDGSDAVLALCRGIEVPHDRILGVRVMGRADAVASSPRTPAPGTWWPGRARAGWWGLGQRRQFWCTRAADRMLVVYLRGRPCHRVVLEVDAPDATRRTIERALVQSRVDAGLRSLGGRTEPA